MRVFVTGATGFIGSAIVPELIQAGHHVIGMTRSDAGAATVTAAGAEPYRATLEDPDSVGRGTAQADGVIHCAFDHDFTNFAANCEKDRRVILALGAALAGSNRPLLITSGTGLGIGEKGPPATEDVVNLHHPMPRVASEIAACEVLASGVNLSVVRLPQVHDTVKQGLITPIVAVTREKGVSAYIDDGLTRWPAAHVLDVARLYRLALERGEAGARYHAVAEEGVTARTIAEAIGRGLNVPVKSITAAEAPAHFGWLAMFATFDMSASSMITRQKLGWHPTGPDLISDLNAMDYGAV